VRIDLNDWFKWFKNRFRYQRQRTLRTPCSCGRGRNAGRWEKIV